MRSAKSRSRPDFAPSATIASASRSTHALFIIARSGKSRPRSRSGVVIGFPKKTCSTQAYAADPRSAAGKAARPPTGAARPIAICSLGGFGDDRFRSRNDRLLGLRRRQRFFAAPDRRALAHRRTPAHRLLGRRRRLWRRGTGRRGRSEGRRGVEIGDGLFKLRLGRRRGDQLLGRCKFLLRPIRPTVLGCVRRVAVAMPVAPASAATAASPPFVVTARLASLAALAALLRCQFTFLRFDDLIVARNLMFRFR